MDDLLFPVLIPCGFAPMSPYPARWDGKICPGYAPPYQPRWGGGFRAGRVRGGVRRDHRAIDIMAAEGAIVIAPDDVWVDRVDTTPKGGHCCWLSDDDGWVYYLAHMRDQLIIQPGIFLARGTIVGIVGRTGNATRRVRRRDGTVREYGCSHLHMSVTAPTDYAAKRSGLDHSGRKVDPKPLLIESYKRGEWKGP